MLAGIEETGRQAVAELHRMLGILRKRDEGAELAPQPSLRRVDALVAQVREAGLDATLTVEGEPAELRAGPRHVRVPDRPGGADQRDALRARFDASASRSPTAATCGWRSATTARARSTATPTPGSGHGIVGMRERAALFGGDLSRAGGRGFVVRARLPL